MNARLIRIRLGFSFVAVLFLSISPRAFCQVMSVHSELYHDVSPAVRDLPVTFGGGIEHEAEPVRPVPLPRGLKRPQDPDPVLQKVSLKKGHPLSSAGFAALLSPNLSLGFDGIGQGVFGFSVSVAPPDTNGAVGLTQYVQWVNNDFAIFDKSSGNLVSGPIAGNSLWQGFGGVCQTTNRGDPVVSYDKLANRWIFSQFAFNEDGNGNPTSPFTQCVAVSTTSDATGTFNRYSYTYSQFNDYPKLGVWPDAYYFTFNMFDPSNLNNFLGANTCAYDRNAMLNGLSATQICFASLQKATLLPSDLDGTRPPPAGSPNYMLNFGSNSLDLFKFHVDFVTPSNSTLSGPTTISVAPFTVLCSGDGGHFCVPQSGTSTPLDALGDRLMYRLAYRNFGDHESLVVNHSVAVGSGGGIRWYEIQSPNGTANVVQQSTFAPDSNFRWMGSIAMDHSGDIAVGYSVSGSGMFPAIAYAGRTPSDSLSTLEPEVTVINGGGSQTGNCTSSDRGGCRWGDYSAMQVDPLDDCTFWYTTEYLKSSGEFNWNTRIAKFRFPGCKSAPEILEIIHELLLN